MLSPAGCALRRRRLWDAVGDGCDVLIVADPAHLVYLANYDPSPFDFRANEGAAILLLEPDRTTLIADNLVREFLDQAHVDEVVAPVWYEGKRSAPHRRGLLVQSALEFLSAVSCKQLGIETACTPSGIVEGIREARPGLSWIDIGPTLRSLRRRKDTDEIGVLRQSMKAADAGFAAALRGVEPGMSELDVFLMVQKAVIESAGRPVQLYGDFVSGPRCESVGGAPSNRRIEPGDLVLLDFSVIVNGYRGDYANTFVAGGGKATGRQRELYAACLEAMAACEAELRADRSARAVDSAVRNAFAGRDLARNFHSHSGHGIGLGHPEPPYFVPHSDDVLIAGDVVTLEPGQYIPGVAGMRYERNYLVTESGFEPLSGHELKLER